MNKIKKLLGDLRKKNITDPYIQWLTFANAGMLNSGNLYCMQQAIQNLPSDNPILEIGSFCGLSTNIFTYFLQKFHKTNRVYTCDRWIFEGAEKGGTVGGSHVQHSDYRQYVKDSYMRNVTFFSPERKPYTIEVFSDEFFKLWEAGKPVSDIFDRDVEVGGPLSFCYIDGNHQYDFARRDFENVHRFLEPGGFVLFDDSYDGNRFGLTKLMKEIKKRGDYRLVIKNPNYLFQKQ
ncbi:MAG: class I SAM-dependent methyltransferase [bacterium]|nr:class I SAM-dependent methyltransferase [bacterium]